MKNNLPVNLYTAEQVRELDRIAIEEKRIPGSTLMARAAEAVFQVITNYFPQAKKMVIVCGLGNNAGDGFVLARIAKPVGWQVTVLRLGDPDDLKGDALESYETMQGTVLDIRDFQDEDFSNYDVVVDAIFGSGLNRAVEGNFFKAIESINHCGKPIISIDIPSGLSSDSGQVLGISVQANVTVSFIGLKRGMFTAEGPDHVGQIYFDDLNVPSDIYKKVPVEVSRLDFEELKKLLPSRQKSSHKGKFGHSLIVGGDEGMTGAPRLACEAALRVGSGLVSLATRKEHAAVISQACPEIMAIGVEKSSELDKKVSQATVVGVGPGLGKSKWARSMLDFVIQTDLPLVVDADALNLLSEKPVARGNWILTPHPREAARLLQCDTKDIQKDRFSAVKEMQKKYGGVVVLKGNGSLIYDGVLPIGLCDLGNPGMASGGMGDALTGIIVALVAQGLTLTQAAQFGVCLHAAAGDLAAKEGERGLVATDLIFKLREIVNC